MSEPVDCVVIGAGVVGLAVARALAMAGREVFIVEKEAGIGTGVSSRNSEVIHAGLYYPPGSLKAALCVRGRDLLYAYCRERDIPHRQCGKLVVATHAAQLETLRDIAHNARANGVQDLQQITGDDALRMEPALCCVGVLWSPSSGIVDSHALMLSLLGDAENHSVTLACKSAVLNGAVHDDGIALEVDGDSSIAVIAKTVINCAGLDAQRVAARIAGLAPEFIPEAVYAKGSYFSLSGRSPFEHLIYPVPEPGGLGVHLTLDLGGQAKFGPDVEWVDHIDYQVDPARVDALVTQVRKYWPGLPDDALQPAYAGIRPKLRTRNGRSADFVLSGPAEHGVAGLFNLFGIESPGLTSALALGELVAAEVAGKSRHQPV